MNTIQENFWDKSFGKDYSDRNSWQTDQEWDEFYIRNWGVTKAAINNTAMANIPADAKILEVGCNIGAQLKGFQRMGFTNLHGVELQQYAVDKALENTRGINIIQGSGFSLPFEDNSFDLVCTNGVLIHIAPADHKAFMSEIFRCTKKFIMGWEYYAPTVTDITYRGNKGFLWKADFAQIYLDNFSELQLVSRNKFPYITPGEAGNTDEIFLLSK